ncbi:MAG: twin-arginine translocation signal domain-containing protein, partial [Kiritimatiellae bacterium]|nr:twin-arginine translocation signal domain-containing protein [Kiritimatiellia bacterium]
MNRRDFLKLSAYSAAAGMAGCATRQTVPAWTG